MGNGRADLLHVERYLKLDGDMVRNLAFRFIYVIVGLRFEAHHIVVDFVVAFIVEWGRRNKFRAVPLESMR